MLARADELEETKHELAPDNFISQFMALTEGMRSPPVFRLWSAISLIGGALERRVWIKNGSSTAFPNLYVLLVAPPGIGKYVVEFVRELWSHTHQPGTMTGAFHVAPDSTTKASLIDTMAEARRVFLVPGSEPLTYHTLLVPAEEFSVLLPSYDMEYIGTLNSIFNNKEIHEEKRRHGPAKHIRIERPQLHMLAGAQPSWLATLFPEEAWATGLGRRLLMIYCAEPVKHSLFYEPKVPEGLRTLVLSKLGQMSTLYGQMKWEQSAMDVIDGWYMDGEKPVPEHTKLTSYIQSRGLFALKLSLIASVARSTELVIRQQDVEVGLGWLLEAERFMPDIFRAMIGRSDRDVIDELHHYITARFAATRKQVPGDFLRRFLLERVPHEKVETLLMAAEKANIIARVGGTQDDWVPRPRYNTAPE